MTRPALILPFNLAFVLPFDLAFVLPFALPFAHASRRMASIAGRVPDRGLRRPPTSQPQPN